MGAWSRTLMSLAAFGLLVAGSAGSAGCSSAPEEDTASADAPLREVCQPLVKSSLDYTCRRQPLGVGELIASAYGTCGACAVSVGTVVASGGGSLFMLSLTGAGCYGCAVWLQDRLGPYDCNPIRDEAVGCQSACRSAGFAYATLTSSTLGNTGDVSCACGTSSRANVCCAVGEQAGRNGQRSCDPDQVRPAAPPDAGASPSPTPSPTCRGPYDVSAPICRTSFTQPTCAASPAVYRAAAVGAELDAELVVCSPTQDGCASVYHSCRYSNEFAHHKCVKNYDGYADYCE